MGIEVLDNMLTRQDFDNNTQSTYSNHLGIHYIARKVKIADLKHNSDIQRLDEQHHPKYELYQEALEYLESD